MLLMQVLYITHYISVFVQVRSVLKVVKEILVHRDIQDSEAQMDRKETREQLVIQV